MLEEDPAKITVHLVQFEKYVPFCMPGAEDTFVNAFVVTWLRRGGRTNVAVPFGRGGVVCVHHGGRCALGVCAVGVVSLRFSCDVCRQRSGRVYLCASSSPGVVGWLGRPRRRQTPPLFHNWTRVRGLVRVLLVRVDIIMSSSSVPCCVDLPRPQHPQSTTRPPVAITLFTTLHPNVIREVNVCRAVGSVG